MVNKRKKEDEANATTESNDGIEHNMISLSYVGGNISIGSIVAVVSPRGQTPSVVISDPATKHNMSAVLAMCSNNNNRSGTETLQELSNIIRSVPEKFQQQIDKATSRHQQQLEEIVTLTNRIEQEQQSVKDLESQLCSIQTASTELQKTLRDQQHHSQQLQNQISTLQKCVSQQNPDGASATAPELYKLQMKTNRLQHQISLFGKMTGIKWDYMKQEQQRGNDTATTTPLVLFGEANIAGTKEIRSFRIDLNEYESPYEIANALWSMLDGKSTKLTTPTVKKNLNFDAEAEFPNLDSEPRYGCGNEEMLL